ncbi:G-type lectin S-receptor-like serine/threonine-protein kinase At2g19130 [Solanum lycopersicum]|uniref:G-type lectin S-receptor-like serine/threonine-protein kinase At2g19130 n=1 Tax=Solanum lycopersicum TaxID=4081 RepID=UPI00374A3C57
MPGISFSTEDTLVSKQGIFELGFFCPGNTEKLFIDARKLRVWSSSLSTPSAYANKAVLLDSGNLVLTNGIDRQWQSFNYPTDTWLPGAMIGFSKSRNTLQKLTSWRNLNDPASGSYPLQLVLRKPNI